MHATIIIATSMHGRKLHRPHQGRTHPIRIIETASRARRYSLGSVLIVPWIGLCKRPYKRRSARRNVLRQDVGCHAAGDVREAEIAACIAVRKPQMVDAE